MTWLVTGGAGYIGSHVVRELVAAGLPAVVLDDLSTGREEFVPSGVPLVRASVTDEAVVRRALRDYAVTGVVHLAALKYAGVSVSQPLDYYRVNVGGTRALLAAMASAGVGALVFSSSAAVYGTPDVDFVTEGTPTRPESPYGETKLVGEWLVRDAARARTLAGAPALRHVSLRYFNVVGSGDPAVYDVSPHNLFPIVLQALDSGATVTVNGGDYPTPDGTCVRDYIHVADLAAAHVAAARALGAGADAAGQALGDVYCLGRGEGVSVQEILDAVGAATGRPVTAAVGPRRPGDPARIVASPAAAQRDLGWTAGRDLADMVASAWAAWQRARAAGTAALAQ